MLLDAQQHLWSNFVGPPASVPVITFRDVLMAATRNRPIDKDLRDSIVIVSDVARPHVRGFPCADASRLAGVHSPLLQPAPSALPPGMRLAPEMSEEAL